jgi:phenylpropionate dioxygenase-like ring-hydroxylating dioxygenase large terminal subunit
VLYFDGMNAQFQFQQKESDDALALGTEPIPAGPYYQPEYFELERQAIFRRTWLNVGHVCELPESGSFILRQLDFANASILIARGKDGVIRAFHNVCPHRGTQLVSEPSGKRSSFTCPYHAWTFSSSGELRSAPDMQRFYVEQKDCGLRQVAVDVCAGLIFLNLDPAPRQSLREFLGQFATELATLPVAKATTFSEYVYEIAANWKLTYDNFQENYHLRFIHPRSGGPANGPDNPYGYPIRYRFFGPHRTQTIWTNPNPAPAITPMQGYLFSKAAPFAVADGFAQAPNNREYFAIFPNSFIIGTPTQHFLHYVVPISATRSRGVIRLYWIGEDDSATKRLVREFMMAMALDIHSEDRAVIEAGQRGLSSGALTHIHFQSQEVLCRHLYQSVDRAVQAYKAELAAAGAAK